jgi:ABC-type transporter Mla MlaB component
MNHLMEEQEDGLRLVLTGELTIAHAAPLREALLEITSREKDACVDLSGATGIDVSGLQLLCSLHRTAVGKGLNVSLEKGIPEDLVEVIRTAGYLRDKGCRLDTPGTCLWKGAVP